MSGWADFALSGLLLAASSASLACDFEAGVADFQSDRPEQATVVFQACLTTGEYRPEANFYLGLLARNERRLQAAARYLRQAVELAPARVGYRLEWAVAEEWGGHLGRAEDIYRDALAMDPDSLPAAMGIARMQHWQGRLRPALERYRQLLMRHPGELGVMNGLAFALMADHQVREARALFQQVLAMNPDQGDARKGLIMLDDIRLHRTESQVGTVRDGLGRDVRHGRFVYTATPSYAWRWGAELVYREGFVRPPDSSGLPVNRSVKSEARVFADYRFNHRTSLFGSLAHQELLVDRSQTVAQLELMHKSGDHRLFAGVVPAFIDGQRVNTLSYAGYVYESGRDWSAMAQFYYGWDQVFPSSRSLALSWTRNYGDRNSFRLGGSFSETQGFRDESVFVGGVHFFNRNWALRFGAIKNLSAKDHEINLGVIHEF